MKKNVLFIAIITIFFTACNSDVDLYNSAEAKYNNKNYSEALKEYKTIIEDSPESEYASKSIMKVAMMYQGFLIPNVSNEQSLKNAVEYYRKMYQLFPNDKETPKALFLCGFLLANDIRNYEEAKITFNTFLDKYKNHELVPQVKLELENLGKTPEEILESKLAGK